MCPHVALETGLFAKSRLGNVVPVETELKLSLPSGEQVQLDSLQSVRQFAHEPPAHRRLFSVYYDTPELDLVHHGIVLRLRKDGPRWLQAVKTANQAEGGLHQRGEFEHEVPSQLPNVDLLPARKELEVLTQPGVDEHVQPVFETDFERATWQLELPHGTRVEVALDTGEVRSQGRSVPIHEIELELKEGLPERLYELAEEIAKTLDVRLENVSKAERGYALYEPQPLEPVKAKEVVVTATMTVEEALSAILWNCLAQVQNNERVILETEDPEGVHQMRVGLRRLRSCLTLFRQVVPAESRREVNGALKGVSLPLGAARDWDVFLESHLRPLAESLPETHSFQAIRVAAEQRRLEHIAMLHEALQSRAYRRLILNLAAWVACKRWREGCGKAERAALEGPVKSFAGKALQRLHLRMVKRARGVKRKDEKALHALRIDIKKQRYAAEFFEALFKPKRARRYRSALEKLQDTLGHLNDAATGQILLGELGDVVAGEESKKVIETWYAKGKQKKLRRLSKDWKVFRDQKRFWK